MPSDTGAGAMSGGRNTPTLNKRRSLPQYCARPQCLQTRSSPTVPTSQMWNTSHSKMGKEMHATASARYEDGWNARRERARLQTEPALVEAQLRRETSMSILQSSSSSTMLRGKPSQPHLKSHSSQQHLLRSSRSIAGVSSRSVKRSSLGSSSTHSAIPEHEPAHSRHSSTDSSSFHSLHESRIRRSRSGSSSTSCTSQDVPPVPRGLTHRPHITTNHHKVEARSRASTHMYGQPASNIRQPSTPYMRTEYAILPHTDKHLIRAFSEVSPQHSHVQKSPSHRRSAHLKPERRLSSDKQASLAPCSTSPKVSPQTLQPSSSRSSRHSSRRSFSHHGSTPHCILTPSSPITTPPPAYGAKTDQSSLLPPLRSGSLEKRAIPSRESLTKWKTESEEVKTEIDGMQRAKVQERVRRANEMELAKEKELRELGKGADKAARVLGMGIEGNEKEGMGCFGGLFRRVWRRVC
jgi:hypothetical protein